MGGWRAILVGDERRRVRRAVRGIADAVWRSPLPVEHGHSLALGAAGRALLFGYLARAGWGPARRASAQLELALDGLAPASPRGLHLGAAGIAWVAAHLGRTDVADAVDARIFARASAGAWRGRYDLIDGLVGMGVYALARLPRPRAARALERIVARLDATAVRAKGGTCWLTPPERLLPQVVEVFPQGYFETGMAHGVAGVVAFLGRVCAAGVARARAGRLLAGAVRWLLSLRSASRRGFAFPFAVARHAAAARAADFAGWCLGDPGVAIALAVAAGGAGRADWKRVAHAVGRGLARRGTASCGIVDAGVCHGSAGVAHLLNRLYQASGEARFRAAARAWYVRTLDMRARGEGIAGFRTYTGAAERPYAPDAGFLNGATGTALALLAAVTDIEPGWDEVLLTSLSRG